MLGNHKFRIGQRVRPSAEGISAHLFPKTRQQQSGIVQKVDEYNCPTVLWNGRKTASIYHPNFIDPDRRRKPQWAKCLLPDGFDVPGNSTVVCLQREGITILITGNYPRHETDVLNLREHIQDFLTKATS